MLEESIEKDKKELIEHTKNAEESERAYQDFLKQEQKNWKDENPENIPLPQPSSSKP